VESRRARHQHDARRVVKEFSRRWRRFLAVSGADSKSSSLFSTGTR